MKKVTLGKEKLEVSRIGLGCMGMSAFYTGSGQDDEGAIKTIHRALELGITFFDTAEIYGPYTNEELLGRALAKRRQDVVIATKFGTLLHRSDHSRGLDGSPENVRLSIEGSLKRLKTDYIDLYYQHRMDPKVPIEETIGALSELVQAGMIRHIGLSEAAPETIHRANSVHPITALQTEYSLWSREPEAEILPLIRELGIGFVAYSPLGRGFLTGTIRSLDHFDAVDTRRTSPRFKAENLEANIRIVEEVEVVAAQLGVKPGQVALAWLLTRGDDVVPIPGTKRINYLAENIAAESIELTQNQLDTLDALTTPIGDRYADMSTVNR
ncbi:MAG TPA: aldo/keto reductase [Candidatus Paceibacterota bacterium]|nr:aldo/keto reductase [Candidatus Paceibacterota bacterium]